MTARKAGRTRRKGGATTARSLRAAAAQASRPSPPADEIRVGISSCLLGNAVRYDGGHKEDALVTGALSRLLTFVAVCPEVEVGMPVPRPPIRLVRDGGGVRLVDPGRGIDHTDAMRAWAERRVRELERLDLSGYILKKDSPSCGLERVKVYSAGGSARREGAGLFAEALMRRMPRLPVAEEGDLHDPTLRRRFISRVLAYRRRRAPRAPAREGTPSRRRRGR